jgi:hypothetical protein
MDGRDEDEGEIMENEEVGSGGAADEEQEEDHEDYDDDESSTTSSKQKRQHKFLIISNCYKTSKIKQLYKASLREKTISQIFSQTGGAGDHQGYSRRRSGEEELKHCEAMLAAEEEKKSNPD